MQGGDLDTWESHRIVIILEGVLVELPEQAVKGLLRKKVQPLPPVDDWAWQKQSIKYLNSTAKMYSLPIDVVTFVSQEVADAAAEYFENYYIEVSSTSYRNFDQFCTALQWTPDVERVVDSDPLRLMHYGQLGYATQVGGGF